MAKILLVNDEPDLLEVMTMILAEEGYDVCAIAEGRRAFEAALQMRPDVVVLDWRLDGITADEVVRQLRTEPTTARAPILLISASPDAGDKARLLGIEGYLRKPFDAQPLLDAVNALVPHGAGAPAPA
jgi:DNA-binding response OmpR family regulator